MRGSVTLRAARRTVPQNGRVSLWRSVAEQRHEFRLSDDVSSHGRLQVHNAGAWLQAELSIKREELEGVVMSRRPGGRTRSHVANHAAAILPLHRAIRQCWSRWQSRIQRRNA
jgi:hypothetical protein